MKDPFYATIKIITGEEIMAEVAVEEEYGSEFFIISDPVIIEESFDVDAEKGTATTGMIPKKWLNYSNDGMHIINRSHVVTMSELDSFGIEFYKKSLVAARLSSPIKREVQSKLHSGYVGDTKTIRDSLEELYKNSHDIPE